MSHHSKGYFSKFMLCFIIFMVMFEFSLGDEVEATTATVDDHQEEKKPVGVTTEYWEKAKLLLQQTHGYFFPPNLDFRGNEVNDGGEGAAGKMKTSVGKSTEKSKKTVEETAKTAAKLAEETLHKTTDTVKKVTGLSSPSEETPRPQQEL